MEGGEQENDGDMVAETEEVPYECGPRMKYPMLFDDPIPLQVNFTIIVDSIDSYWMHSVRGFCNR